jgi:hypothetical protein
MKRFFHCLEFLDAQRVVDFLAEDDSRIVDGLNVAVVEPLAGGRSSSCYRFLIMAM